MLLLLVRGIFLVYMTPVVLKFITATLQIYHSANHSAVSVSSHIAEVVAYDCACCPSFADNMPPVLCKPTPQYLQQFVQTMSICMDKGMAIPNLLSRELWECNTYLY